MKYGSGQCDKRSLHLTIIALFLFGVAAVSESGYEVIRMHS